MVNDAALPRVRLEGFHAVKHALRFAAPDVRDLVTPDPVALADLVCELAPDLRERLGPDHVTAVDRDHWLAQVGPRGLPSPLLGSAARPALSLPDAVGRSGRLVVLENPRHAGNVGAVVRVAAAVGAAAVVVAGDLDPWAPRCLRGAAGLHYATGVVSASVTDTVTAAHRAGRPVVGLDGAGERSVTDGLSEHAVLLLGTERHGLSAAARSACDVLARIPMTEGVSSLNLATAAAIALYAG